MTDDEKFISVLLKTPGIGVSLRGKTRGDLIKAIRSYEWSMGNGQCPICSGGKEQQGAYRPGNPSEGHRDGCTLAGAMSGLGMRFVKSHPLTEEECRREIRKNRLEILFALQRSNPEVRPKFRATIFGPHKAPDGPPARDLMLDNPYLRRYDSLHKK